MTTNHTSLSRFVSPLVVLAMTIASLPAGAQPPASSSDVASPSAPTSTPSLALTGPALGTSPSDAAATESARTHARRLSIAGWSIFGTSLAVFTVFGIGGAVHDSRRPSTCDPFYATNPCAFDLTPAQIVGVWSLVTLPAALVGGIVGGRGTYLRRHQGRTASVAFEPTVSRAFTGVTLRGAF